MEASNNWRYWFPGFPGHFKHCQQKRRAGRKVRRAKPTKGRLREGTFGEEKATGSLVFFCSLVLLCAKAGGCERDSPGRGQVSPFGRMEGFQALRDTLYIKPVFCSDSGEVAAGTLLQM